MKAIDQRLDRMIVSIHAPARGVTIVTNFCRARENSFNPRPLTGGDRNLRK